MTKCDYMSFNGIFRGWNNLHILRYTILILETSPLQKVHEQIQGVVRVNEKKLETVQKLLKLKLITKGIGLTSAVIYYKICNVLLGVLLKIL